jgi:hypothetical protein
MSRWLLLWFATDSRKNPFENVACSKGVPLKILDLQTKSAAIYDGSALLLSRRCCPGGVVPARPACRLAQRAAPANPLALIDRARGAANQCS